MFRGTYLFVAGRGLRDERRNCENSEDGVPYLAR